MPASRCTSRLCTAQTITILPSRASRAWRGRCGLRSQSTRAPAAKCPRPRGGSAVDGARSRKVGTGFPPARSPWQASSFGLTLRRAKAGRKRSCAQQKQFRRTTMAVYTVHEPPRRNGDAFAHTERFTFVRDGFAWPAFLFAPLWMLRYRLWLALIVYLL